MSAGNQKLNLSRTNSICPPPETVLLDGVKRNEVETIKNVIITNPPLLSYEFSFPYEKPILQIACSEDGIKPETVKALIDLGADLSGNEEWKPLHLAAQNPNSEILEVVLKYLKPGQINQTLEGNNALHSLIKCEEVQHHEGNFVKNVELLLKAGINVNMGDGKNMSPILSAAQKGFRLIVKTILEKSIADVDLDSHKNRNKKTARQLITEKQLYNLALPGEIKYNYETNDKLFALIKQSKENEFISSFKRISKSDELVNCDDGFQTFLQYACERGLVEVVNFLIDKNVNVNQVTKDQNKPPIELVAETGHFEIFSLLLNQPAITITANILCFLIKNLDSPKFNAISHEICFKLLIEKIKTNSCLLDINGEDDSSNTPLHYALRYANKEIIQELLRLGASLASRNKFGLLPVEDIKPEILENHLDECIKFDINNKNYEKRDFEVIFDYRSLVPARKFNDKLKFEDTDPENRKFNDDIVPEIEVISYMSRAPELKYLLKHPVVVSFLFMKWHRIRLLFYTNLLFYIMFVLSLVAYIFTYYCNFSDEKEKSEAVIALGTLSFVILTITFFILILRELFQIAVSPSHYFQNFENFIEVILIILSGMILFISSPTDDTRKQLSSVAILLAAFELILMVGQHPKLSTNVVMFKTVSVTFFKLLVWYSLLIIAFALSFYILFAKTSDKSNIGNEEEEEESFAGPGKSFFKTIIMLTGEFDAGSINFHTYPITSKLIFSLFIFMITIILLNLLNGLAVSDTHAIKNDAELVGHIARAHHIHYVESMLMGNILPTSALKFIQYICCCFSCDNETVKYIFFKPLAKKVCLFQNNQNCQLCVLPNNHGRIYYEFKTTNKVRNETFLICPKTCSETYLDKETVRRANAIIKKQREGLEDIEDVSIHKLYDEYVNVRKRLDEILNILTQSKIEIQ